MDAGRGLEGTPAASLFDEYGSRPLRPNPSSRAEPRHSWSGAGKESWGAADSVSTAMESEEEAEEVGLPSEYTSTGLGLPLSLRIARLMDGSLAVMDRTADRMTAEGTLTDALISDVCSRHPEAGPTLRSERGVVFCFRFPVGIPTARFRDGSTTDESQRELGSRLESLSVATDGSSAHQAPTAPSGQLGDGHTIRASEQSLPTPRVRTSTAGHPQQWPGGEGAKGQLQAAGGGSGRAAGGSAAAASASASPKLTARFDTRELASSTDSGPCLLSPPFQRWIAEEADELPPYGPDGPSRHASSSMDQTVHDGSDSASMSSASRRTSSSSLMLQDTALQGNTDARDTVLMRGTGLREARQASPLLQVADQETQVLVARLGSSEFPARGLEPAIVELQSGSMGPTAPDRGLNSRDLPRASEVGSAPAAVALRGEHERADSGLVSGSMDRHLPRPAPTVADGSIASPPVARVNREVGAKGPSGATAPAPAPIQSRVRGPPIPNVAATPLALPHASRPTRTAAATEARLAGLRVLIVDDERLNRRLLARMLNRLGINEIDEATDGSEVRPAAAMLRHYRALTRSPPPRRLRRVRPSTGSLSSP